MCGVNARRAQWDVGTFIETFQANLKLGLKSKALIKNLYFLSSQAAIQALVTTHVWVILTEFYDNRAKIVDFLLSASFEPCRN